MKKPLLLEQLNDKYVRENFRRVQYELDSLVTGGATGPQGPIGPQGPEGEPGYTTDSATVPSSGSDSVGSADISLYRAAKFLVTMWNVAQNVTKVTEMIVVNRDDTTGNLKQTVAFKTGSKINMPITPVISGGNIILNVTNNEAYTLQVEVRQVLLGSI